MPKKRQSPLIPQELPPCEGPKLNLFKHHDQKIHWIERIGYHEGMGTPNEGYVFRVKIKDVEYALKVFKFFDPMEDEDMLQPLIGRPPPDTAAYYTDPFYAECRAYGRIREPLKRKRKISDAAVRCHGFLFLGDHDQKYLEDNGYDLCLDQVHLAYQRQTIGGLRPRAIVKDLASSDHGVTGKTLKKVLNRIVALNQHKIYNLDIHLGNFRDGKLVDFGSSWTEPNIILDGYEEDTAVAWRLTDRVMFDDMVEFDKIPNPKKVIGFHPMYRRSQDPSIKRKKTLGASR